MPNYTPGPWEADRGFRDAGGYGVDHYTLDDDFLTVFCGAEASEDFDPEKHDYIEVYGPNQEANARLIAAAPDLFEALQHYVGKFGNCGEAYDQACEAIKKACIE